MGCSRIVTHFGLAAIPVFAEPTRERVILSLVLKGAGRPEVIVVFACRTDLRETGIEVVGFSLHNVFTGTADRVVDMNTCQCNSDSAAQVVWAGASAEV